MADRSQVITVPLLIKAGFLSMLFVGGVWLLVQSSGLLLIIFAGILLAVLLDAAGRALARYLPISRSVGVATTGLIIVAAFALGFWLTGPNLVAQATRLGGELASGMQSLEAWVMSIDAEETAVDIDISSMDWTKLLPSPSGFLGSVTTLLGTTFGLFANLVLVMVFGIYLALDPETYTDGVVRLVPPDRRARACAVLKEMAEMLRHWLAGKALMMLLIGILSYIGLTFIGVPLALLLAVVAGATAFIPIIGPAIAGVLMVLVALTESWQLAFWAGGFYLVLQTVESYLLLPLIQSRAVALPAGVVIAAQVLMGIIFGALGVALATPLAAVAAVAIKRLYIEDVLKDDGEEKSLVSAAD